MGPRVPRAKRHSRTFPEPCFSRLRFSTDCLIGARRATMRTGHSPWHHTTIPAFVLCHSAMVFQPWVLSSIWECYRRLVSFVSPLCLLTVCIGTRSESMHARYFSTEWSSLASLGSQCRSAGGVIRRSRPLFSLLCIPVSWGKHGQAGKHMTKGK